MTTDRDMARLVRSWLEPGLTSLTDDVLDAVLEQLPTTPQRRGMPLTRRIVDMRAPARMALAAVAVLVIAIVGVSLSGSLDWSRVGTDPSPSPSPSATSGTAPLAPTTGALEPGRYRWTWPGGQVTFEVPDGWVATEDGLGRDVDTAREITLVHYLPDSRYEVTHVYADACQSAGQLRPVGPGIGDDLLSALDGQLGTDLPDGWTEFPLDTADGYWAQIREARGLDRSTCRYGSAGPLQVWADEAETGWFALAPGYEGAVYVFDVNGIRVVFTGSFRPEAAGLDGTELAALDAIVSSFEFTMVSPSAPGPAEPLRLPGTRASPAGVYGFEGAPGRRVGMHKVVGDNGVTREATALIFAVGDNCIAETVDQEPQAVRIGGWDGVSIEPYEPPVTFIPPDGDEVTRAHALDLGDRNLCVFLTWHSTTTDDEVAALVQVLETLRAEPIGETRIRVTFTLDDGWDVG